MKECPSQSCPWPGDNRCFTTVTCVRKLWSWECLTSSIIILLLDSVFLWRPKHAENVSLFLQTLSPHCTWWHRKHSQITSQGPYSFQHLHQKSRHEELWEKTSLRQLQACGEWVPSTLQFSTQNSNQKEDEAGRSPYTVWNDSLLCIQAAARKVMAEKVGLINHEKAPVQHWPPTRHTSIDNRMYMSVWSSSYTF